MIEFIWNILLVGSGLLILYKYVYFSLISPLPKDTVISSYTPKLVLLISGAYSEKHRHYHNLSHIADMFDLAKRWGIELTESETLAIWFHHIVYDTEYNANEEDSAKAARLFLKGYEDLELVCEIISDTAYHIPTTEKSNLVLDLDMAILGTTKVDYRRYAKQVRKEYKHLTDKEYNFGRREFLTAAISKAEAGTLFYTSYGKKLTRNAILNMREELERCLT